MQRGLCALAKMRREVGEREESGINFFDELAVGFGFILDGDPFRIFTKRFPVSVGGFARRMHQHVDEGVALQRIVRGQPVGEILDAVLFEDAHGVVAEAGEEGVEFTFGGVINAEFVDGTGRLRERGKSGWKKSRGGNGLEKLASFHGEGL